MCSSLRWQVVGRGGCSNALASGAESDPNAGAEIAVHADQLFKRPSGEGVIGPGLSAIARVLPFGQSACV
jgi:hypothetical protein